MNKSSKTKLQNIYEICYPCMISGKKLYCYRHMKIIIKLINKKLNNRKCKHCVRDYEEYYPYDSNILLCYKKNANTIIDFICKYGASLFCDKISKRHVLKTEIEL